MGFQIAAIFSLLLFVSPVVSALNCTDTDSIYYCTIYDDDGDYLYDGIRTQTIVSSEFVPELKDHSIYIYPEATFYHGGRTQLRFDSVYLGGTAHLFLDGHSDIVVTGNLTLESGASLSIGTQSTVRVEGWLRVEPGVVLYGVANTAKEILTFAEGEPDFTQYIVRQNSMTKTPEIFFQRKLCETPAFSVEAGRQTGTLHRLYVCEDASSISDSVVIYDKTPIRAATPPIRFIPLPVPVPVPTGREPTLNNQTGANAYLYNGIDIDPRRVWPYYIFPACILVGILVYVLVGCVLKKKIKTKLENVKILFQGSGGGVADEYELAPMGSVRLEPDFESSDSSSKSPYDEDERSVLMTVLQEGFAMISSEDSRDVGISRSEADRMSYESRESSASLSRSQ